MAKEVKKSDIQEAEETLVAIRKDLEKLHRLAPDSLSKPSFNAIVALLPSSHDILAASPHKKNATATTTAFATLRFTSRVLTVTFCRALWLTIYILALIGCGTVGFGVMIYALARMPWATYEGEGNGWRTHSDGYYYWGMPQESYTSTVAASVVTDVPEIDGRDI
ncbi:hypothetical protein TWF696_000161 [Orbilia brochopaga]|uniref:Uncharacterized protein n=1 Tax=Orbilia brochopaga TaxID=3140254 RepID=A0AAV9VAV6_9PEZI